MLALVNGNLSILRTQFQQVREHAEAQAYRVSVEIQSRQGQVREVKEQLAEDLGRVKQLSTEDRARGVYREGRQGVGGRKSEANLGSALAMSCPGKLKE